MTTPPPPPAPNVDTPARKPFKSYWSDLNPRAKVIAVVAVLGLLAGITVGGVLIFRSTPESRAIAACKADLRDSAFDPDAVQFRNMKAVPDKSLTPVAPGDVLYVSGEMNGKNKFGAYVGFEMVSCRVNDQDEVVSSGVVPSLDDIKSDLEARLGISLH